MAATARRQSSQRERVLLRFQHLNARCRARTGYTTREERGTGAMKLTRDGSEPRRGVFRIEHDDGSLSELKRLGEARQLIRTHAEQEARAHHHAIEAERKGK